MKAVLGLGVVCLMGLSALSVSCSSARVDTGSEPAVPICRGRLLAYGHDPVGRETEAVLRKGGFSVAVVGTAIRANRRVLGLDEGRIRLFDHDWPAEARRDDDGRALSHTTLRAQVDFASLGGSTCVQLRLEPIGFVLSEQTQAAILGAMMDAVEDGLASASDVEPDGDGAADISLPR